MDAYVEEESDDNLTYSSEPTRTGLCRQTRQGALENIFFSIEPRVNEEICRDARPYRAWWNDIADEWNF